MVKVYSSIIVSPNDQREKVQPMSKIIGGTPSSSISS